MSTYIYQSHYVCLKKSFKIRSHMSIFCSKWRSYFFQKQISLPLLHKLVTSYFVLCILLTNYFLSGTRKLLFILHYYFSSDTTTKTLICPGWETPVVPVSQPGTPVRDKRGCPFVPGLATGTKEDLLSRLVTPTGTKGPLLSRLPHPGQKGTAFCPGQAFPVGKPGQQRFLNRDKSTFL